jgi:lysophospholipase L1-like esterase
MLLMSVKLIFFSIVSLLPLTFFSECRKKDMMEPVESYTIVHPLDTVGISYLALGDSYTKAECEIPSNSYPAQLVVKFQQEGIKVKSRTTIAQTGWRTDNLKNAITAASLQDTFDLVSLLIGVNNQFQGQSPEIYRTEFRDLLETAIYYAKGRKDKVFVLSIPDYGMTPFGSGNQAYISQQIDVFNAINKDITDSMGVRYFDITPISRKTKKDPSLTCTDHLHPSAKMYAEWVDLMLPKVLKIIAKP